MIMRTVLATLAISFAIVLIGGAVFVYSGVYDIGATTPHWPITHWVMETARVRSIKAHAAGISAPPGLDDPAKLLIGTEHFAAHCAVCHGAPGVPKGDIAQGLYPQPPDLAVTASGYSEGELFWIVKRGIKMTGMPAWIDHSDEELWAIVAFIKELPGMSEQDYARLVMASMAHGGHHHGGSEEIRPGQTKHDDHEHH
jgi:mono/diheme cytochrome c family protein